MSPSLQSYLLSHINKQRNEISMWLYDITNTFFIELEHWNIRHPDDIIIAYINIQIVWNIYGKHINIIINKNTITLDDLTPVEMDLSDEAILIVIELLKNDLESYE